MIRIICRERDDRAVAACAADHPEVTHKTFDIEAPELEAWLKEPEAMNDHYVIRTVIGVEVR